MGFVVRKTTSGEANDNEANQISPMVTFALNLVEQNSSGLQMAYQRSMEMQVSVRTETLTEVL